MNSKFRILLTNDDGHGTNGLLQLEKERQTLGEVWVVTPDRERSCTSQALTIRGTLRLKELGGRHFTVDGYPSDCVNVALNSRHFPDFDLVISGVNHGLNLGDDVHYSGTVGAARHAAVHRVRAIAVSCPIRDPQGDFRRVSGWVRVWVAVNFSSFVPGIVYNINYPEEKDIREGAPYPAFEITRQGRRVYLDVYEELEEGGGNHILRLQETSFQQTEEKHSDVEAYEGGLVSITPLGTYTTDAREYRKWKMMLRKGNA